MSQNSSGTKALKYTRYIEVPFWISMIDVSLHLSLVSVTTIRLYLRHSTGHCKSILTLIRCFTATEDFNTPAERFITNLRKRAWFRACPAWRTALTTVQWEGFWGILKRERCYGNRFTSKQNLVVTIRNYIAYYNGQRVQRNLDVLTPLEKYSLYLAA
jgi:hypothetical protein